MRQQFHRLNHGPCCSAAIGHCCFGLFDNKIFQGAKIDMPGINIDSGRNGSGKLRNDSRPVGGSAQHKLAVCNVKMQLVDMKMYCM